MHAGTGANRLNVANIRVVQLVCAVMPVLATEGTLRQRVLHDVEELAIAGKQFHFAVAQHIPSKTEARSHLVRKAEVHYRSVRHESRNMFFVKAHAHVQRQATAHGPCVLNEEGMVPAADFTDGVHSVTNQEVTICA